MEFVSPEGLRIDGRRPQELRAVQCHFGALSACDGSALFQAGNTKVVLNGWRVFLWAYTVALRVNCK